MSKQQFFKFDENDKRNLNANTFLQSKQKKKAIALSVASCLFISLVGYEIVREGSSELMANHAEIELNASYKKPSLENEFTARLGNLFEDDEDDHEIRQLKENNARQSARIRALRQELLEKVQNIYAIKADLFKQEGSPKDKEKIAELARKLQEKDQQIQASTNNIAKLERKIAELEKERLSLLAQKNGVQKLKDEEISALREEMDGVSQITQSERTELEKRIRTLEATQYHLVESLEKKTEAITILEKEINIQSELKQQLEGAQLALIAKTELLEQEEAKKRLLEHQLAQHESQVSTFEEKQEHLLALEKALVSLSLDSEYMEKTLESSQLTINSQAETLASLKEDQKKLECQLEDELEKKAILASALLEKQQQANALEEKLANLLLEQEVLELQLAGAQQSTQANSELLALTEKNERELRKSFESEVENRSVLEGALAAQHQLVSELQSALGSLSKEKDELKEALDISKKVEAFKSEALASAENGLQQLNLKLQEEIQQKAMIGDIVLEREIQTLALEDTIKILTVDINTLKEALDSTQVIVINQAENFTMAEQDLKELESKLQEELKIQREFSKDLNYKQEHILELEKALTINQQEIEQLHLQLKTSYITIDEKHSDLERTQKEAQGFKQRLNEEFEQRSLLAQELEVKQEHVLTLENAFHQLSQHADAQKLALNEAKELIAHKETEFSQLETESNALKVALEASQSMSLQKTKELESVLVELQLVKKEWDDEVQKSNHYAHSLLEKQQQVEGLEKSYNELALEKEHFESDLKIARDVLAANSVALEEARVLRENYENEVIYRNVLSDALVEKKHELHALDQAYSTLSQETEKLKVDLQASLESSKNQEVAIQNSTRENQHLQALLKDKMEEFELLVGSYRFAQTHSRALEDALSALSDDSERLLNALEGAQDLLISKTVAFESAQEQIRKLLDSEDALRDDYEQKLASLSKELELARNVNTHLEQQLTAVAPRRKLDSNTFEGSANELSSSNTRETNIMQDG